jgi:2-hydroxychromene-2-carboxylate isomerase
VRLIAQSKHNPFEGKPIATQYEWTYREIDERECIDRAEICGISASDFQITLRADETLDRLNTTINSALDRGEFGVPTFIALGELFWRND